MGYIRTVDNVYDTNELVKCEDKRFPNGWFTKNGVPLIAIKQANTIEELMMIGDLVFKKNGDIFVIPNQAYIDYYIAHKSVSKLFIKTSKGNYIRVAEENEEGKLELL